MSILLIFKKERQAFGGRPPEVPRKKKKTENARKDSREKDSRERREKEKARKTLKAPGRVVTVVGEGKRPNVVVGEEEDCRCRKSAMGRREGRQKK